jgi:2-keto-3-deoxy-L-rhamnonate aldolase RhmA
MQGQTVRQRLRSGQHVYGTHICSLGNPMHARINAGLPLDFVFICSEHMPIDRTEIGMMCEYYGARGISPMVRIPYPSAREAAMAVDAGAQGIVAPYVETAEEVEQLIGALRYRPIKGRFLADILAGRRQPAPKLAAYLEHFNRDLYLVIGVESVAAVDNLDTLLAYDAVDAVFLGPHDLTCSLEIPEEYENPRFVNLVCDVIRRCLARGKGVGIHADLALPRNRPFLDAGQNLHLHLADVVKMTTVMSRELAELRARHGDTWQPTPVAAVSPDAGCVSSIAGRPAKG